MVVTDDQYAKYFLELANLLIKSTFNLVDYLQTSYFQNKILFQFIKLDLDWNSVGRAFCKCFSNSSSVQLSGINDYMTFL